MEKRENIERASGLRTRAFAVYPTRTFFTFHFSYFLSFISFHSLIFFSLRSDSLVPLQQTLRFFTTSTKQRFFASYSLLLYIPRIFFYCNSIISEKNKKKKTFQIILHHKIAIFKKEKKNHLHGCSSNSFYIPPLNI